eukprot:190548_1
MCVLGDCVPFSLVAKTVGPQRAGLCVGVFCPFGSVCIGGDCEELTIRAPDNLLEAVRSSSTGRLNSCDGIECEFGQVCYDGVCNLLQFDVVTQTASSCKEITCDFSQICVNGVCEDFDVVQSDLIDCDDASIDASTGLRNNPCAGKRCPLGQVCVGGECKWLDIRAPEFDDPDHGCNDGGCVIPSFCDVSAGDVCIRPVVWTPGDLAADSCFGQCPDHFRCVDGECVYFVESVFDCFPDCFPIQYQCKCPGSGDPCLENTLYPCGGNPSAAKTGLINDINDEPQGPEAVLSVKYFDQTQVTLVIVFIGLIGVVLAVTIFVCIWKAFYNRYSRRKYESVDVDVEKQGAVN